LFLPVGILTTLLKCLNRVLAAQEGSVFVDGKNLKHLSLPQIARRMSWVPQQSEASRMTVKWVSRIMGELA
jgi:iron complex transport system ATP-binding protein